jgi:GNAT superfamily N-acetyltransferase
VLAEFRGRGVQQALMATRLQRALALGSTLAAIISHPHVATERNAVRLGFALGYTRVVLVRPDEGFLASL